MNPTDAALEIRDMGATLVEGTMVGEYRIDHKLADGGMASVYLATHPVIRKRVAIKVMAPELSKNAVAVERFLQEARSVNQVGHPNIVDVFSVGQLPDGRNYLVMEMLSGESLADRLWRNRLSLVESLEIIDQVTDALEAAHREGIVHRDLKPDNIFIEPGRGQHVRVKLIDFGILGLVAANEDGAATVNSCPDERATRQTSTGTIVGTPCYMAPEQARGEEVGTAADIYSLGVMAYEMVLGQVPFDDDSVVVLISQHLLNKVPPPRSLWPEIPSVLDELLLAMLAKDPSQRPTLTEIRERVAEVRATLPADAFADEPWVHSALRRLSPVKRRILPLVAAVAVVAGLAFAAGTFARNVARADRTGVPSAAPESPARSAIVSRPTARLAPSVAPVAAALEPGALVVTVNATARIEVDGAVLTDGAKRTQVELVPGAHELLVRAPGRRTHRATIVVVAGQSTDVTVTLPRRSSLHPSAHGDDYMLDPFGHQ